MGASGLQDHSMSSESSIAESLQRLRDTNTAWRSLEARHIHHASLAFDHSLFSNRIYGGYSVFFVDVRRLAVLHFASNACTESTTIRFYEMDNRYRRDCFAFDPNQDLLVFNGSSGSRYG